VATWRTDLNLKILGVTRSSGAAPRSLPVVGQVVSKTRPRTGILESAAHLRALEGTPTRYQFKLFRRNYEVRLVARKSRSGSIIGVRGTLRTAPPGAPGHDDLVLAATDLDASLESLRTLRRRRYQASLRSAIRSLELAKAMAETAQVNAEIRMGRAKSQHQKALRAQVQAEEEERRARLLADASAILDSSFDQEETLNRVGNLLVLRMVDWCVFYLREEYRLKRIMCLHRDAGRVKILDQAFPARDESGFLESGFIERIVRGRWEYFSSFTPEDAAALLPPGAPRRALLDLGVQSLMRVIPSAHGRIHGVLILGSDDPRRLFAIRDLQMTKDLASRIAIAGESSKLYAEAQREIALRREAEERLRVFNVELERRVGERTAMLEDAMREANSFAYTVAHDLRAPLRAITGFCQALAEDYSGIMDEMGKDYLDRVVSGARRMDELIRDLLDYARLNRAEIRKGIVDLDGLIDEVLQPMTAELDERRARVSVAKPLGGVVGEGLLLGQALTNLISNAMKFVAPGVAPEVSIRTKRTDDRVRILVADNGIGIAPEHQERIFGIFERLNRAEQYPGTGIGLAIVRRAVERLGGSVGVESRPGAGSRFWIELPSA
jgi:signal transduction histidine kinase